MRVLIWKPGIRRDATTGEIPNIGMAILAAEFKNSGHEVRVIDHHMAPKPDVEEGLTVFRQFEPDLICISMVSYEWVLPVVHKMIDLANAEDVPVWIGGPHATAFYDIMAEDPRISKIVNGEVDGNLTMVFESSEKVINLPRPTSFTKPDFTLVDDYEDLEFYPLFTSRGCKYRCNFCAATVTHGNLLRPRTLDDVWAELDELADKYTRVHTVWVIDDDFLTNIDHAMEFLRGYENRGYSFDLNIINVRADMLTDDFIAIIKRLGITQLSVGLESADPEVFRRIGKGEKLETAKNAIVKLQENDITPWLNMIIGLPYDSLEAHQRSLEWVTSLPKPRIVQWLNYAPFRNTRAYDHYVEMGAIEDGFVPGFQGQYEEIPQPGFFDIPGFDRDQQRIAQLESYLRCHSPILIMNDEEVQRLCRENGLWEYYEEWRANAPIEDFVRNTVPVKIRRGQIDDAKMGILPALPSQDSVQHVER